MKKFITCVVSIICIIAVLLSCSLTAFAHGGRTDSSGGHKDNKNKSGLGSYHYHCGGYPAHLHSGGYCPYTDVFPSSVSISVDKKTLGIGEKVNISGSVSPANSCNTSISWSCSDTSVVVLKNGVIEAVGYGTATITAESFNGKIGSVKITVKEITAEKVSVSGVPSDDLYIGDSFQMNATITPENVDNPSIEWSSSDPEIASITNSGLITLNNSGTVTITATASNGVTGSSKFTVKERFVESVVLEDKNLPLFWGDVYTIVASVEPANATYPELTWISDHPEIASVSTDGVVTALACGQAIITATSTNGISNSIEVNVSEVVAESVAIIGDDSLVIGSDCQLQVSFTPTNTTIQNVVWSVDDPSVATISEDGKLTAVGIGSTTVYVKQKDVDTSITITVLPIDVTEIIITASVNDKIKKDDAVVFSAEVLPLNATYPNVTWSVSDESIATIDVNGVLTALKSGSVIVTATADDGFTAEYELKISSPAGGILAVIGLAGAGATGVVIVSRKKKKSK